MSQELKDAFIDVVNEVKNHHDADRLDVIKVRGWTFVVPRDAYTVGEKVLCVMYDGQLDVNRKWCTPYLRYLGKNGRVKNTKLRGVFSDGIITKLDDPLLLEDLKENNVTQPLEDYFKEGKLCTMLGVSHWTLPVPQDLSVRMASLPFRIPMSDEERFQNLSDEELGLGYTGLITKKLDGTSCTIAYDPKTDDIHVCSRSMSLKIFQPAGGESRLKHNNYTRAAHPYLDTVKFLGHVLHQIVALRGEVCGPGIQKMKINQDQHLPLNFYMYGVHLPEQMDRNNRYCWYENCNWHFTKINSLINRIKTLPDVEKVYRKEYEQSIGKELTDMEWSEVLTRVRVIPTVPIIGEAVITKELLEEYKAKPKEFGEGVVINWHGGSYKVKSDDYYYGIKD